jgi:hypothetical protein
MRSRSAGSKETPISETLANAFVRPKAGRAARPIAADLSDHLKILVDAGLVVR